MQKIVDCLKVIDDLNILLETRCTGSATDTAKKLNISTRTLSNHRNAINDMLRSRNIRERIIFDKYLNTYRFSVRGKIVIDISFEVFT